ncbi:putative nuclease HARBI1 [Haliotis rufescens]|uniref:putative nuclease HARBI1 n=1 Tax=Haliotis rufescens TaxID=6454 RepID=UPI00201F2415|nr:putative nuclease HARBI1 [Haliotis rufescens]
MAANILFERLGRTRKDRVFRKRTQHLESMSEEEVRARYRFGKASIGYICDLVRDELQPKSSRSHALSVELQVLVALRFFASGSFLQITGDTIGIDKSTASRVVRKVSLAIASLVPKFVTWPSERDIGDIRKEFYNISRFPGVIGCIDGTHVRIQAPSDNEPAFVNRKGYHSINVQAVCDSQGKFTNLVARWPGSTHDSHVFKMSNVRQHLETHHTTLQDGVILGDSGYACRPYLMTPYLKPSSPEQERFNSSHKRTRSTIERAFGWLKRRFHVLHGEIRMSPERVCTIIGACAVLHNLAIILREPMLDVDGEDDSNIEGQYTGPEDGRGIRDYITRHYFTN